MATFEFTKKLKSSVCSINDGYFFTFSNELYYLSIAALDDTILNANSITQVEHNFNIDVDTDIIIIDSVTFTGTTAQDLYDSLETLFFLDEGGGGSDVSAHHGFFDYNDTSTSTSSISLLADVWANVPNDGLGTFTNLDYIPTGMTKLMDTSNGSLDFTELTLGSDVLIRIDFNVTPQTNNALLESRYVLGTGAGLYSLPIVSRRLDSGAGIPYSSEKGSFYIYMGDTNTLDNPGTLQVKLSTGGTLVNNGLAIKVYKR